MQIGGQAEIADPVYDAEIDGFRAGAHFARYLLDREIVNLRRRSCVNILAAPERVAHRGITGKMGEQAQLDLRIVRVDQRITLPRDEGAPDFLAELGPHGNVLQVWLAGRDPAGRGDRLIEPGMNASVRPDQA